MFASLDALALPARVGGIAVFQHRARGGRSW